MSVWPEDTGNCEVLSGLSRSQDTDSLIPIWLPRSCSMRETFLDAVLHLCSALFQGWGPKGVPYGCGVNYSIM